MNDRQRLEAIVAVVCKYLPPNGISRKDAMREIIGLVDPMPEQPKQNLVCDKDPFYCWSIRCQVGKVCKHTELHKCEQLEETMTPIFPDQYERLCFTCGACTGKPWVGLTEGELIDIQNCNRGFWTNAAKIEQLLKDKNT